jgi:DNA-binding transcriptional ArsR family regulator
MDSSVKVVFKPINEAATSLQVFADKNLLKYSEMSNQWANETKNKLSPDLLKYLQRKSIKKNLSDILELLVVFHDQPFDSFKDFTTWLNKMSIGELAQHASLNPALLKDFLPKLEAMPSLMKIMTEWENAYFSTVDPEIIEMLAEDAREKQKLAEKIPTRELVEKVTGGVRLENLSAINRIYLVPQYHARPFNLYALRNNLFITHYPVETSPEAGEPSARLLRMTSALGDSNRLKILRQLSRGENTFMEIVSFLDISKSTVHYHMAMLRLAGLIRAHIAGSESISYSLRKEELNEVSEIVKNYIMPAKVDSGSNSSI